MAAPKKVFDVAKPGKSAPAATSRPIIVGHKSEVEDPMVSKPTTVRIESSAASIEKDKKSLAEFDSLPSETTAASKSTLSAGNRVTITPLSHSEENESVVKETSGPADATPTEPQEESQEEEPTEEESAAADAAVVEAVASQAQSKGGKKDGESSEQGKAQQEHLKKLVADKTYFVPVAQATRRRNRRAALVVGIIVILLVIIFLLASLSIIKLPFKLQLFGVKLYNAAQYVAGNKSVGDGQIDIVDTSPDTVMKTRVNNLQVALVQYKESNKAVPTIDELNSFTIKEALKKFHPELEFKDAYGKDLQFVNAPAQGEVAYITLNAQGQSCTKECTYAKLVYTDKSSVEHVREIKGLYEYLSKPN